MFKMLNWKRFIKEKEKNQTSEAHDLSEKFRACYQPQLRHDSLVI